MQSVRLQNMLIKIDRGLASRYERTRWQAAITLGDLAESNPEAVWTLVVSHGSRWHGDVRMAIATCVLEHLLEHHFETFFPRVAIAAKNSRWFSDTFSSCYQLGQAKSPRNARRWKRLRKLLREIHDKTVA